MGICGLIAGRLDAPAIGEDIYSLAAQLYPICRSITGPGVRESLAILQNFAPLEILSVASGTPVLDWTVPKEWSIRDAFVKTESGERVIDFHANNLHVMSYSIPVCRVMPLAELKQHIFTLPDQPDLIPYRTSYYTEKWAFCMSHRAMEALSEENYEVMIDSSLEEGELNYGEYVHRGETDEEFLFTAHICHPSLANENCSGLSLLAHLAARMRGVTTRYTYRFLWAPATIGAITWLAAHEDGASRIKHGLVLSSVGDASEPTYKRTRRGDALIDRAMSHVLAHTDGSSNVIDFFPFGYDERQYNSPGFQLNVGMFQRGLFGTFPEYHTSADNLDFIAPEHLASSYRIIIATMDIIENDARFINTVPKGEPQLGRRGLYTTVGGDKNSYDKNMTMLWLLNLSDGEHSLLEIAERAKVPFPTIFEIAQLLQANGLLIKAGVAG
jgi:aminopeptidase-like protein